MTTQYSVEWPAIKHFSDRIRFLVNEIGFGQLAKSSGISPSALRSYQTGSEPTRPVLLRLSDAAGCTLDWLATGAQAPAIREPGPLVVSSTDPTAILQSVVIAASHPLSAVPAVDLVPDPADAKVGLIIEPVDRISTEDRYLLDIHGIETLRQAQITPDGWLLTGTDCGHGFYLPFHGEQPAVTVKGVVRGSVRLDG